MPLESDLEMSICILGSGDIRPRQNVKRLEQLVQPVVIRTEHRCNRAVGQDALLS